MWIQVGVMAPIGFHFGLQIGDIAIGHGGLQQFLDDRLEIGQRADGGQAGRLGGPQQTAKRAQQQSGLDGAERDGLVAPAPG